MALPSGCSDRSSAEAAASRTCSSPTPATGTMLCTPGRLKVTTAPHGYLARQEFEEIADRFASTAYGESFKHLGDQHEQRNDQSRKELSDGGSSGNGDSHGKFHRHPPLQGVLESFHEDRPAANEKAHDADQAYCGEGFPKLEPYRRCRQ